MPTRDLDVVLYGATGYTGELIAEALDEAQATFAVAGRTPEKLETLSQRLSTEPETIVASIDDDEALDELAGRARVVLSAAGPFEQLGPPIMDAAIRQGTHFADITGEQAFLRWAADQDARARRAGVTVVNAMGFDVVPSDMAASLAARGLDPVETIELFIASNSGRSAGTLRTMARSAGKGWRYEQGKFVRTPPGRYTRKITFPTDLGEQDALFIPWGDVATAPRSTGARNVRTFFTAGESTVQRMNRAWPVTLAASYVPLLGKLFERKAPPVGHGPSEERREKSWFQIMGIGEDRDGHRQRSLVTGLDPYGLTAAAAARGALALARDEVEALGVVTPTQAFTVERLAKLLPEFELEWSVEAVGDAGR